METLQGWHLPPGQQYGQWLTDTVHSWVPQLTLAFTLCCYPHPLSVAVLACPHHEEKWAFWCPGNLPLHFCTCIPVGVLKKAPARCCLSSAGLSELHGCREYPKHCQGTLIQDFPTWEAKGSAGDSDLPPVGPRDGGTLLPGKRQAGLGRDRTEAGPGQATHCTVKGASSSFIKLSRAQRCHSDLEYLQWTVMAFAWD